MKPIIISCKELELIKDLTKQLYFIKLILLSKISLLAF